MFAQGPPLSWNVSERSFVAASPDGSYVLELANGESGTACRIMSAKGYLPLGASETFAGDAECLTACWKHNSKAFAVLTSDDTIRIFRVSKTAASALSVKAAGVAQEELVSLAPRRVAVEHASSFRVDNACALATGPGMIAVGCSDGTLRVFLWSGEEKCAHSVGSRIVSCTCNHKGGLIACVTASGALHIVRAGSGGAVTTVSLSPDAAYTDACAAEFHPRGYYLAVGRGSGTTDLWSPLSSPKDIAVVAMEKRGTLVEAASDESTPRGGVSCLRWSPDGGRVLAVGYSMNGFSLWSVDSLSRLFSTAPQSQLSQHFVSSEVCAKGTKCIAWASFGFHLYVKENGNSRLVMFNLVKCSGNYSMRNSSAARMCYHASDYLVILEQRGADDDDQLRRTHVHLPSAYLVNWPIVHVAVSNDANFYAVAGTRGLAIYSRKSHRWRLFGNVSQEQGLQCCGLLWYHKEILCAVERAGRASYKLLLYPRRHLDNESILASTTLPGKPIAMDADASKGTLVVRFRSKLVLYRVLVEEEAEMEYPAFSIEMVESIQLDDVPRTVDILPGGGCRRAGVSDFIFPKLACLDIYGKATIVDTESKSAEVLLTGVHQIFSHSWNGQVLRAHASTWPPSFEHCLFLVTGSGVELWIPSVDPNRETEFGKNVFSFVNGSDLTFVGATNSSNAALIGVHQKTYYVLPGKMPSFEIESHARPCLDVLLGWLLTWYGSECAHTVLEAARSRFSSVDASIELLLHKAATVKVQKPESTALKDVIRLIELYPAHERAGFIVRLTRKLEPSDWHTVLDITDSPLSMFEACVKGNAFRNAAGCLVIARQMGDVGDVTFTSALAQKLLVVADKFADDEVLVSELEAYCRRFAVVKK